jgi:hypothetical protein
MNQNLLAVQKHIHSYYQLLIKNNKHEYKDLF